MSLVVKIFHSEEARPYLNDLAALRIDVFKDFPYLYLGDFNYENNYLERYLKSPSFLLVCVFDGVKMVGASTALKLEEEAREVIEPIENAGLEKQSIFYFGESVLLEAYRGLGVGHIFFDEREKHARSYSEITTTCFCSVVRPEDHPLRPKNYKALDEFWSKRGYIKKNIYCEMSWKDISEITDTPKKLQYWFGKVR